MALLKLMFTTVLIKVLDELLSGADDGKSLVFVLLHLAATFDTFRHCILLKYCEPWVTFMVYLCVVIYGNLIYR